MTDYSLNNLGQAQAANTNFAKIAGGVNIDRTESAPSIFSEKQIDSIKSIDSKHANEPDKLPTTIKNIKRYSHVCDRGESYTSQVVDGKNVYFDKNGNVRAEVISDKSGGGSTVIGYDEDGKMTYKAHKTQGLMGNDDLSSEPWQKLNNGEAVGVFGDYDLVEYYDENGKVISRTDKDGTIAVNGSNIKIIPEMGEGVIQSPHVLAIQENLGNGIMTQTWISSNGEIILDKFESGVAVRQTAYDASGTLLYSN